MFVLFELISLLHLIKTEEKLTIHQLLFIKKQEGPGLKVKDKIDKEERMIKRAMNFMSIYTFLVKAYGCLPRFLMFRMYTHLQSKHLQEFEIEVAIYTVLVIFEEAVFLAIYVYTIPVLLYKMFYISKTEFKLHAPGLMIYSLSMIIYKATHLSEYIFLVINFLGDSSDMTK